MKTLSAIAIAILLAITAASATVNVFRLSDSLTGSLWSLPFVTGPLVTVTYRGMDNTVYTATTTTKKFYADVKTRDASNVLMVYTVTPTCPGFTFSPVSMNYQANPNDTLGRIENMTAFTATDTTLPVASVSAQPNVTIPQSDSARVTVLASDNTNSVKLMWYYVRGGVWTSVRTDTSGWWYSGSFTRALPVGTALTKQTVAVVVSDFTGFKDTVFTDSFTVIDTTKPAVHITSPVGGENWASGSTHNVTWTASDNVSLASVQVSVYTGTWTTLYTGLGTSAPWTAPTSQPATLKFAISGTDASGNVRRDTTTLLGVVDTTKPTVALNIPGGQWYTGMPQDVQWTANDNRSLASVTISYTTNGGSTWTTVYTGLDGSMQFPTTGIMTTTLRILAKAVDAAGNTKTDTSANITVTEISGPSVTVNTVYPILVGTAGTVTWNATDYAWITSYKVSLSRDGGGSWVKMDSGAGNPGTYTWTVAGPAGQGKIMVDVWNPIGRTASAQSATFSIIVPDVTKPTISFKAQPANVPQGAHSTVKFTATDDVGVAKVVALVYNGATWAAFDSATTSDSVVWLGSATVGTAYKFRLRVYDGAGNCDSATSNAFSVVDTTRPTAAFVGTLGDLAIGEQCKVKWTASDNVGLAKAVLSVSMGGGSWIAVDSGTTSPDSSTWQGSTPGTYRFRLRVTDAAGNADTALSDTFQIMKPTSVAAGLTRGPKALGLTGSKTGAVVALDDAKAATFSAWDAAGRLVTRTTFSQAGWHSVALPRGLWLTRLVCGNRTLTRRLDIR